MRVALDRIDPATMRKDQVEALLRVLGSGPSLVGPGGERFTLPEPLVRFIARTARAMQRGQSVALVLEKETLTTQEAADYLGTSRPFLIGLLERGEIPFTKTGTHRRILSNDLRTYEARRDETRRATLDRLFDTLDQDGFYELGLDPELGQGG